MIVLAIVSAKGGVGKTTVTANLGAGIAARGYPVSLIDLDPQNSLQWHLGVVNRGHPKGVSSLLKPRDKLDKVAVSSPYGVNLIPFGLVNETQRQQFEDLLERDELWLRQQIERSAIPADSIVLLDTPPGPTVYMQQAIHAADFLIVVVLADAASYSTLPEMEELIATYGQRQQMPIGSAYVVNQGAQRQLAQDVVALFGERLGKRMVPFVVNESAEVEEALAHEKPVILYRPENPAALSLQSIIDWLLKGLQK